jgi:hypothetical protein
MARIGCRSSYLLLLALGAHAAGCGRDVGVSSRADTSSIRSIVALQASTELALSLPGASVDASSVYVEQGPSVGKTITVLRLWIPRDHWHAYQVAVTGSRVISLGGFQNPNLAAAAENLAPAILNAASLRELAERLALLADDYGGVQYYFGRHVTSKPLLDEWRANAPMGWPRDSVERTVNDGWRVTLTLLSRNTRSHSQPWLPMAYVFHFDSVAHLNAWSQRRGPVLNVLE